MTTPNLGRVSPTDVTRPTWLPVRTVEAIPAHWRWTKIKYVASLKSGESITSDSINEVGEYPVFGGNGVRGFTSAYTHSGKYVLIGRQGALCGNINYALGDFWASEHAVVVNIKGDHDVNWLGELLHSMNLNQYSQSAAQPGIGVEVIANLAIPVPPLNEQRMIADYLKRETTRIDALVAEKEHMLALLDEKRAALISRAVTRGLNSNAPLKHSGLDWLGDIPAHWQTRRLKYLTREPLAYGANEAALEDNHDWPRFVRITDINEEGTLRDETFRSLSPEIAEPYLLEKGDVLFARSGATVGKSFIYRPTWGTACFAGYLIRFRSDQEMVLPDFVYYFSLSDIYWQQVRTGTIQATIPNFSAEKYADLIVCLPPPDEQNAIVVMLNAVEKRASALITEVRGSIERLIERRSALITAAVMGQLTPKEMAT